MVDVDGKVGFGVIHGIERNLYRDAVMYYIAIMDCNDNIPTTFGSMKHGKLIINTEVRANEDHFSYEE